MLWFKKNLCPSDWRGYNVGDIVALQSRDLFCTEGKFGGKLHPEPDIPIEFSYGRVRALSCEQINTKVLIPLLEIWSYDYRKDANGKSYFVGRWPLNRVTFIYRGADWSYYFLVKSV